MIDIQFERGEHEELYLRLNGKRYRVLNNLSTEAVVKHGGWHRVGDFWCQDDLERRQIELSLVECPDEIPVPVKRSYARAMGLRKPR